MSDTALKASSMGTNAISVWLVDDNQQFSYILNESLGNHPSIRCTKIFESGDKLLSYLENPQDLPDIILLDINMPGTSGIEVLAQMQIIAPELRIIMLTVNFEDDNIRRAIQLGAAGYLLKTASVDEIEQAVVAAMQGGKPIDSFVVKKIFSLFALDGKQNGSYDLTQKEKEILQLIAKGISTQQTAEQLYISPSTVHTHLKKIFKKLDVHSRHELVAKALQERLL